jgi:Asp-tRNA(Asn)/Glu-tRNA(Gln) amidotransferase A subunit family amidase
MFAELVGEGDFKAFTDMLEGEPLVEEYNQTSTITQLNCCMFGMAECLMNSTQPRLGLLIHASRKLTTYEYMRMIGRLKELRAEWVRFWQQQKLDLLVCPGFGMEAPNHGTSNDGSLLAAYTFIWNLLAMPAATTPVTIVRQDEQHYESAWDDDITKVIRKNVADSAGLPVGVQIVGMPFEEEKLLGVAKRIESYFKFYQTHPLPINKAK